ncbi:MAG: PAS domain S-box protein [Acidobacteriota bacterium]
MTQPRLSPSIVALAVAAAAAVVATFARWILTPVLAGNAPFLTYMAAVALVARYTGFWAAIATSALSLPLAAALFLAGPVTARAPEWNDIARALLFLGVSWLFASITERLRVLSAAEGAEAKRLRIVLQSIGDAVIVSDAHGQIVTVNPEGERLTGWTSAEAKGQLVTAVFNVIDEDTRQPTDNPAVKAVREHTTVRLAHRTLLVARDGTQRPVDDVATPLQGDDGVVTGSVLVFRDTSERRRAAEATAHLAAIVESSDDAVLSKTLDGRILTWNAGAEEMFGYSAAQAVGRSVHLVLPDDVREREADRLAHVARGEHVESFETARLASSGERLDVSLTLSPIRNEAGVTIAASSIARDIRRQKQLEQTLRDADRRKDEFLAVLAHELRNPLAPIWNSVATMRLAGSDQAVVRQATAVIDRQSRHMARLLDDLLDVSRITRDKLDLRRAPVTLQAVVDLALETTMPLLDAAGQTLSRSMPPEPVPLDADIMRLAQVFSNLLSNASKYSARGSIVRLTVSRSGSDAVVTVTDDGIGIAPDALSNIFEMFSQAPQPVALAPGGLGIGLALVRGLVGMHGGRVSAASEGAGHGSTFEVRLPIAPAAMAPAVTDAPRLAGSTARRILIADDNQDGADSLAILMRAHGHDVLAAYDGAAAVRGVRAFRPEIVLLDLGMPVVSGFEAARQIRAIPEGRDVMLVAVTGWGQKQDRDRTREAGFDLHLVKPVDTDGLLQLLHSTRG